MRLERAALRLVEADDFRRVLRRELWPALPQLVAREDLIRELQLVENDARRPGLRAAHPQYAGLEVQLRSKLGFANLPLLHGGNGPPRVVLPIAVPRAHPAHLAARARLRISRTVLIDQHDGMSHLPEAERRPAAEDAGADHRHIGGQVVAGARSYRRRLRQDVRAERARSGDGKCPGACTGRHEKVPTIHVTLPGRFSGLIQLLLPRLEVLVAAAVLSMRIRSALPRNPDCRSFFKAAMQTSPSGATKSPSSCGEFFAGAHHIALLTETAVPRLSRTVRRTRKSPSAFGTRRPLAAVERRARTR